MKELNDIKKMASVLRGAADKVDALVKQLESEEDMSEEELTNAMATFMGHMVMFDMQMKELAK